MTYKGIDIRRRLGRIGAVFAPAAGAWRLRRMTRVGSCDLLLARSIIPGAMALVALAGRRRSRRPAFVYDADGLPADERADFGGWKHTGVRYRVFRAIERAAVLRADVVLTRTRSAVSILAERSGRRRGDFLVVTNGRVAPEQSVFDDRSRSMVRQSLGVPQEAPLLVYAGSVGPQYLPDQMMAIASEVMSQNPGAHFAVFTSPMNHERIKELATEFGVPNLVVRSLAPDEVATHLAAGDVGLALRSPTRSQAAVAPIKIAEYLLSGLPVVYTLGIGDLDEEMDPTISCGVEADRGVGDAANWITAVALPRRDELRAATRLHGEKTLSIERGAADYRVAFERALQSAGRPNADRNGLSHRS